MKSMRLFVAILLSDGVKDELCGRIERLKRGSLSGTFTRRENLHLTLAFIGETERFDTVKRAVTSIDAPRFTLALSGCGAFRREGGDVVWAGTEKSAALDKLYLDIGRALEAEGLPCEKRTFRPHLTLGRRVVTRDGFDMEEFSRSVKPEMMTVGKISVMKSERVAGRLVYTEMYSRKLGAE